MTDETTPPKRLRAADVIDQQHEVLMAAVTRRQAGGAVKFTPTMNAKGDVQGSLEISAELGSDIQALQTLVRQVVNIGVAEFKRGLSEAAAA